MPTNLAVTQLPSHLKDFIIDQNYEQYTARNHAVWRYVMRQSLSYLSNVAHHSYLQGLKQTGVEIDFIPSLEKMNNILEGIGWGAVCVDGFIPPATFMEFQMNKVLVIAADIRSIDQIGYTPAPDIIHEAAGHAPIISDKIYAEYLRKFGDIGSKAFSSNYDNEVYKAIRHLSILKADPNSKIADVKIAEDQIAHLEANPATPSEMAFIRNLHWWTVEYGLIGTLEKPKIYGAGLLSSIGESVWAMSENVEKISYSLEAMDYSFDITKPQPQLFVTPSFEYLNEVLDEFARTMSYAVGGIQGMEKAVDSQNLATATLKSGLQISGVFSHFISQGANVIYVQCKGPSMLSYEDKMIENHGKNYHSDGYGTAIGKLKGALKPMRLLNKEDIKQLGLKEGHHCNLEFDSGLKINGEYISCVRKENKLLILSFINCTVQYKDQVLFQPEWGTYDLSIGEHVSSVYAGVADPESYELKINPPTETTHKITYSSEEQYLFSLYKEVRNLSLNIDVGKYENLVNEIIDKYPHEWLLLLEAYEFILPYSTEVGQRLLDALLKKDFSEEDIKHIQLGLELLNN